MKAAEMSNAVFFSIQDGNGYIDELELDALLKDLCEKNKKVILRFPFKLYLTGLFLFQSLASSRSSFEMLYI